jgi:hypothetical protein
MEVRTVSTSDDEVAGEVPSEALSLVPGEEAMVCLPSIRSPLQVVPDAAFANLLVVSATRPPAKVEQLVRDRGGDPETVGVVPVSGSRVGYDGPMWTAEAVTPADLSGISDAVERASRFVKRGEGWVVFDNVNVLLMYAERDSVRQLVRTVAAQSRRREARGVFALVPEAVSTATYRSFADVLDTTVDLAADE